MHNKTNKIKGILDLFAARSLIKMKSGVAISVPVGMTLGAQY
jgi:hypothetical protein